MTKIATEYTRYQGSSVMKKLAEAAHGQHYIGQTSSATYDEIARRIQTMSFSSESCILDAGSGNGAFSVSLASDFPFYVEGIELSQELVKEAANKAACINLSHKCQFSAGDFTLLPNHSDARFDLIICIGSLYWGQALADTLAAWKRVTRSNGQLLIFLNLLYAPLTSNEKDTIAATQFIPVLPLQEELAKQGWALTEWSDGTNCYIEWLQRWCAAMEKMAEDIVIEMGEAAALQLTRRFTTYLSLAERHAVRRIILRAEHA